MTIRSKQEFKIHVALVSTWADSVWTWKVTSDLHPYGTGVLYEGTAFTRWGAFRKAERAARKHARLARKGKLERYLYKRERKAQTELSEVFYA